MKRNNHKGEWDTSQLIHNRLLVNVIITQCVRRNLLKPNVSPVCIPSSLPFQMLQNIKPLSSLTLNSPVLLQNRQRYQLSNLQTAQSHSKYHRTLFWYFEHRKTPTVNCKSRWFLAAGGCLWQVSHPNRWLLIVGLLAGMIYRS